MSRYRRIAYISRVKGLSGEVVAVPESNLPFQVWQDLFLEGLRLWIVPPDHGLVRETSVRTVRRGTDMLTLGLAGADNAATAQRLVGRYLLALATDCPYEPDEGSDDFVGMKVEDGVFGFIGTVVEERSSSMQSLLVVEGPLGEVLIPVVDEFIKTCDGTTVFVELPQGLVELNQ